MPWISQDELARFRSREFNKGYEAARQACAPVNAHVDFEPAQDITLVGGGWITTRPTCKCGVAKSLSRLVPELKPYITDSARPAFNHVAISRAIRDLEAFEASVRGRKIAEHIAEQLEEQTNQEGAN